MVEIVAEISGNHGGDLSRALSLITSAALAGCDYAKFQFYRPEDMPYNNSLTNMRDLAMYKKLMVPDEWLPKLFRTAKTQGIGLFASVFSVRATHEILKYDVPYIKIASPKSTRLAPQVYEQIVKAVPADVQVIASSDEDDFEQMSGLGLTLYCPEWHPPKINEGHFSEYRKGGYWGFSDHTPGIRAPLAFIRDGANMIEKHLKLDDDCVDAAFSADPQTMKLLCKLAKNA